jgi:hypothetical protein
MTEYFVVWTGRVPARLCRRTWESTVRTRPSARCLAHRQKTGILTRLQSKIDNTRFLFPVSHLEGLEHTHDDIGKGHDSDDDSEDWDFDDDCGVSSGSAETGNKEPRPIGDGSGRTYKPYSDSTYRWFPLPVSAPVILLASIEEAEDARVIIIRIDRWFLALQVKNGAVTIARRVERKREGEWTEVYCIGGEAAKNLPFLGEPTTPDWAEDSVVELNGRRWRVIECTAAHRDE